MSLVVLIYHTLYDDDEEYAELLEDERPYAISTQQFDRQLGLLKQQQITIADPKKLLQADHLVDKTLFSKPSVMLTFDDGHRSHYQHAMPILEKHGCSAVFFIITAFPNHDSRYCNWRELTEMANRGMSIQAHGHSHLHFSELGRNYAADELKKTTQFLVEHLDQPPIAFSFPGGDYLDRDLKLAKHAGLSYLFTANVGRILEAQWQPGKPLPRLIVRAQDTDRAYLRQARGDGLYLLSRWCTGQAKVLRKKIRFRHLI
jgi:peptidoglycan/xylan/chitin deacetylase (PgdA/CDA1 family)